MVVFHDIADYRMHGREIEFAYKDKEYSITNHSGFWYLCDDTDHILLDTVCPFEEKNLLISKIADFALDGLSIRQIFDAQLYDTKKLSII